MPVLEFQDWGLIDYEQALAQQEALVEAVIASPPKNSVGYLIFCSHPPVVTLGRKSNPEDLVGWTGPVVQVSRGGRATYHGPSQLVAYPILPVRDIHKHLRSLELAIVDALALFGLAAQTSVQHTDGVEDLSATGVWVGKQKIASIGIAVRKWISFHGLALNVDHDPKAFQGLRPCGYSQETMVSMEQLTGQKISREDLQKALRSSLEKYLGQPT